MQFFLDLNRTKPTIGHALGSTVRRPTGAIENRKLPISWLRYYLKRKDREFRLYRDLFIYLPFLFIFTFVVLRGKGLGGKGYFMSYAILSRVRDGEFDQGPGGGLYFEKTWETGILEESDFWQWVFSIVPFIDALFGLRISECPESPHPPWCDATQYLKHNNKLLGIVRFSQFRAKNKTCEKLSDYLHGAQVPNSNWKPCYEEYIAGDAETADRSPLGRCGTDFPLGTRGFNGWKAIKKPSDLIEYPGVDDGTDNYVEGRFASYPMVEAYIFDFAATDPKLAVEAKLQCMKDHGWIDSATRAVVISFFFYNPSQNLFDHVQLLLEITASGSYDTFAKSTTFEYERFSGVVAGLNILIIIYVVYFIGIVVFQIVKSLKTKRIFNWLFNIWNWVEVTNMAIFCVSFWWKIQLWKLTEVEFVWDDNTPGEILSRPETERQAWLNVGLFARLENYSHIIQFLNGLQSVNGLLCWLKIFKFVSLSPHFNLLSETIKESAPALVTLLVYIFVIMMGFAMMAQLLYGHVIEPYRNLERSFGSLFRLVLGDFDYDLMNDTNRTYTAVFFFSFVTIAWLVILNLVIGIIAEGFTVAKARQAAAIRTLKTFVQQKSSLVTLISKLDPNHPIVKNAKIKSPIQRNKILGVPLPHILSFLNGLEAEAAHKMIDLNQFNELWNRRVQSKHKDKGGQVALALWNLMDTLRESIQTANVLYIDEWEKKNQSINHFEPLRMHRPESALEEINTGDEVKVGTLIAFASIMDQENKKLRHSITRDVVAQLAPLLAQNAQQTKFQSTREEKGGATVGPDGLLPGMHDLQDLFTGKTDVSFQNDGFNIMSAYDNLEDISPPSPQPPNSAEDDYSPFQAKSQDAQRGSKGYFFEYADVKGGTQDGDTRATTPVDGSITLTPTLPPLYSLVNNPKNPHNRVSQARNVTPPPPPTHEEMQPPTLQSLRKQKELQDPHTLVQLPTPDTVDAQITELVTPIKTSGESGKF